MIFVDYETRSQCNLPKRGGFVYSGHATTEILMVGVSQDMWDRDDASVISNLSRFVETNTTICSWGDFDRMIFERHEGAGSAKGRWIDAMALARYAGMPAGLDAFATAVGIPVGKMPEGKRLIRDYCVPQADGSFRTLEGDDLRLMEEYCKQDVRLLRRAWDKLEVMYPEWQQHMEPGYEATYKMNQNGVPIDRVAAGRALDLCKKAQEDAIEECESLCGLKPTQSIALAEYFGLPDVRKQTLEAARFENPAKERVRQIRLASASVAAKKLVPMLEMSAATGRAHGCFIPNGARTGRGSSRQIQFQNMVRSVVDEKYFANLYGEHAIDDPIEETRVNIRGFVKPRGENVLVAADYSQVEARIVAWLADCQPMLDAFMDPDRDIYREFASRAFGKTVDEITSEERNFGKIVVLGAGYGAGGAALNTQAKSFGLDRGEAFFDKLKTAYRETYPEVPQLWNRLNFAAGQVVNGNQEKASVGPVEFDLGPDGKMLRVTLPSGRKLRYMHPAVVEDRFGNPVVEVDDRRGRRTIWGGHWLENLAQAIATDLKLDAMDRLTEMGSKLVMEVHDEVVVEEPVLVAQDAAVEMVEIMEDPPHWAPYGLIRAEAEVHERYSK